MKKSIFILFLFFTSVSFAQINELGGFLGGSNYMGDIGRENYIYPNSPAFGVVYKWNMHPQFSLRANYTYSKIKGDDKDSDNSLRQFRGLNFTNSVHELVAGIEYHFFKYNLSKTGFTQTPYIFVQAGVVNYDTRKYETTVNNLVSINKRTFNFAMPFGVGYKFKLAQNIGMAIETGFRYTFKDDIDGYPRTLDGVEIDYSNHNDWYVFTGITVVYAFGREGCYTGRFF